jgi:hypothetical protein
LEKNEIDKLPKGPVTEDNPLTISNIITKKANSMRRGSCTQMCFSTKFKTIYGRSESKNKRKKHGRSKY